MTVSRMQSLAKFVLEEWGASVAPIPTSQNEESDFLATLDSTKYLIEEKTKFDDPSATVQIRRELSKSETALASTSLVQSNRLSGIVKKAASQLLSSSDHLHDFRLVWFTATGVSAEARYHQFIATLYGSTNIVDVDDGTIRACYFFRNSEFFRCARVLDGAVVAYEHGQELSLRMCLNPCSSRFSELRDSPIVRKFGAAVENPRTAESDGRAFVIDGSVDRKDEQAVLNYLREKYRKHRLVTMDMTLVTAILQN